MDSLHFDPDQPARYRICTQGSFDAYALELFSDIWAISVQNGVCVGAITLIGQVADQAALMGVLEQLYCLGLPILWVEWLVDE